MEQLKRRTPSSLSMKGSEIRLLALPGSSTINVETKLYVLSGEGFKESRMIQSGEFTITMLLVAGSPVAAVTCEVGDHRWILARDSVALRVSSSAFLFSFPGFIYGLVLPVHLVGPQARVAEILREFSAYQDISGDRGDQPKIESQLWTLAYSKIEQLRSSSSGFQRRPPPVGSPTDRSSLLLTRKIEKAMRSSAVTKLITRSLLSGILIPAGHLIVSPSPLVPALVLPSVRTCSELVESMEYSDGIVRPQVKITGTVAGSAGFWWLNTEGTELLAKIIKGYTTKNIKSKKRRVGTSTGVPIGPARMRLSSGGFYGGAGAGAYFGGGASGGIGMRS